VRWDDVLALQEDGRLREAVDRAFERRGEDLPSRLDVDYVRFKRGTSCLLGLGDGTGLPNGLGYVKLFESEPARTCVEKYRAREKERGWVEELPELNAALFRFPLDRTVDGLGVVSDVAKLKHVLHASVPDWSSDTFRIRGRKSAAAMLKYKPERRGLAAARLALRDERSGEALERRVVVQAYADGSGARVHRILRHLASRPVAGDAALRVPRPLGYDASRRILSQEWVPGVEWAAHLGHPMFGAGCRLAGRILRELREVDLPDGLAVSDPFAGARTVLDDLADVDDCTVRSTAGELARELDLLSRRTKPLPPVLCHGDFHYHQLLVAEDARSATLLDWDEARIGDPREDTGNLLAHLHLLALDGRVPPSEDEQLRNRVLEETGPMPDLATFVALALVQLAFVPFRNLRTDWRSATGRLLERAGKILAGSKVTT